MEQQISITWTNPSLEDLQAIFAHSNTLAGRIDLLKKGFLEIGQIEPLLVEHPG